MERPFVTEIEDRNTIEKWIQQWGGSISEAVFDSKCHFFQSPNLEGFIGFRLESQCAVVLGDPVCPEAEKPVLGAAFHRYCQEHKIHIIYINTSAAYSKWAIQTQCKILIEVGEEITFNPQVDPTKGSKAAKLRNYIHHAESFGLSVKEYLVQDKAVEQAMHAVGNQWLKARKGPQIHLGGLDFFESRQGKRWFYLQDKEEKMIGMALLSQLEVKQGWLLKFLITAPETPRGASEFLMVSILNVLKDENCTFLTYGMVPQEALGEIMGLGKFSMYLAKSIFKLIKWIFNLNSKKIFWQKFKPKTEPTYLLFSHGRFGFHEIRALLKTLKVDL